MSSKSESRSTDPAPPASTFRIQKGGESMLDSPPPQSQLAENFLQNHTRTTNIHGGRPDDLPLPLRRANSILSRHQQPNFMILSTFLGCLLVVGHHAFYLKLDRTFTGTETRQQVAHTAGNILAILVATSFAFASRAAYKQYFWTVCLASLPSITGSKVIHCLKTCFKFPNRKQPD